MKTVCAYLLTLVLVCAALGLAGPSRAAYETISPTLSRTAVVAQPPAPAFKLLSVQQLRGLSAGNTTKVLVGKSPTPGPGATLPQFVQSRNFGVAPLGANPYATGQGVALTVIDPMETATTSSVLLLGVQYSSETCYWIQYRRPEAALYQSVRAGSPQQILSATFRNMPKSLHTYMLTLGHTADPGIMIIKIGDKTIAPSQLTHNAATAETRVLITYDGAASGADLVVFVHLNYPEDTVPAGGSFHHLQLAQID